MHKQLNPVDSVSLSSGGRKIEVVPTSLGARRGALLRLDGGKDGNIVPVAQLGRGPILLAFGENPAHSAPLIYVEEQQDGREFGATSVSAAQLAEFALLEPDLQKDLH